MKLQDIDWNNYPYTEKAVLSFAVSRGQILLILKKTGLGKGKINAPGGHIEPGETPLEAAIRESQEEIGVTPLNPEKRGELFFIFTDGYSLHCHVFLSTEYEGTPYSTKEADPHWFKIEEIPFDRMWEDDKIWLPGVLEGKKFNGRFIFEDDRMLEYKVDWK